MQFKKNIFLSGLFLTAVILTFVCFSYLKKPLISVVMPTYNRADLLPRSIESILNQTVQDFEFIIVDDGSTDNSVELILAYQKQDKRIRLIRNGENKGISYSRNKGMDAARGKYLAIMDSDDFSVPERFEKSLRFFKKHPDYAVVNSVYYEIGNEDKGLNNWVPPKRWEIIFNFANYYTNLAVLDLDFIRKHHIRYDESLISAEDYDFWSQVFLAGGKLGMINEPLVYLRRHLTNSKEYYDNIKNMRLVVSRRLLKRFGISDEMFANNNRCGLMALMLQAKNLNELLDEYVLQLTYNRQCGVHNVPENTLYVKHFDYVDDFLPVEQNVYRRAQTGDLYRLVSLERNTVIFLNPMGKEEKFRIQEDNSLGFIEDLEEQE